VRFDKITARINKLSYGLNLNYCDPVRAITRAFGAAIASWRAAEGARGRGAPGRPPTPPVPPVQTRPQVLVAQKVAAGVYKGVTTSELDELAAETAAALTSSHPDYAIVSPGGLRGAQAGGFPAACGSQRARSLLNTPTLPSPSSRRASRCPTSTRTR
jgi:hypothetical protein